jgi:hypothetical protein
MRTCLPETNERAARTARKARKQPPDALYDGVREDQEAISAQPKPLIRCSGIRGPARGVHSSAGSVLSDNQQ